MPLDRFRFYIVVFALLAFTGQSFALASIPCATMAGAAGSAAMADVPDTDHSAHLQAHDPGPGDASDCCAQTQCAMTHCAAATVALVGTPVQFPLQLASRLYVACAASSPITATSPLLRPPISR